MDIKNRIFSSTGEVLSHILLLSLALICRASDRLSTKSHHFTLLLPNSFPAMVLVLAPLRKPCTSKIWSTCKNWYCTWDKKRSPSKEQLMLCKSFKLLRIPNSGLQPLKELLRSVQIIKELWRPFRHGDCHTTHKVKQFCWPGLFFAMNLAYFKTNDNTKISYNNNLDNDWHFKRETIITSESWARRL